jgi:hypothetical protein
VVFIFYDFFSLGWYGWYRFLFRGWWNGFNFDFMIFEVLDVIIYSVEKVIFLARDIIIFGIGKCYNF